MSSNIHIQRICQFCRKEFIQIAKEYGFSLKTDGNSAKRNGSSIEKSSEKDENIRSESKEEVFYSPVYGRTMRAIP